MIALVAIFFFPLATWAAGDCAGTICDLAEAWENQLESEFFTPIPQAVQQAILNGEAPQVRGLMIIKFGASWCKPCRQLSAALEANTELTALWRAKQVVTYEWTLEKTLKSEQAPFEVKNLPTVVFFKDGVFKKKLEGAKQEEEIVRLTQEYTR